VAALCGLALPLNLSAQTGAPVAYTIAFPKLAAHTARVQMTLPTNGQPAVELMMAQWTPGYYRTQDFAAGVDSVSARGADGSPLAVQRSRRNRWRVETGGAPTVTVSYRVKAASKSLMGNWVGDTLVVLNGAPTFLTPVGAENNPATVTLALPAGWTSMTALDSAAGRAPNRYQAPSFGALLEAPIVAGRLRTVQFDVAGRTHMMVNAGDVGDFSDERGGRAILRLVAETQRFWGFLPYDHYVFLNLFRPGRGGMGYPASSLLNTSTKGTESLEGFQDWLAVAGRAYIRAFVGARLRPAQLGAEDFETPLPTPSLWITDGLGLYYGDLLVARAGLARPQDWLGWMSHLIADVQGAAGRNVQTLSSASLDAWKVPAAAPDMNSSKTVSFSTKGAVVGFLLDAHIRTVTAGAKSLDDVMRAAYTRFADSSGYTPEQFRALASQVADTDLTDWFHRALDTTQELDYQEMLDWYGFKFAGWGSHLQHWTLEEVEKPTPEQLQHQRDILRADTPPLPPGMLGPGTPVPPDTSRVR
jgi:predicted metalloprotease with PDZ domain